MRVLSLEERGAYNTLLDLMYQRAGPVPDDDRWLAGWMKVSVRKWLAVREVLVREGKIIVRGDGKSAVLTNARFDAELAAQNSRRKVAAEKGSKGGRKTAETKAASKENSDLDAAPADDQLKLGTVTATVGSSVPNGTGGEPPSGDPIIEELSGMEPKKRAWGMARHVLMRRGGKTDPQARTITGGWMHKDPKASPDELWEVACAAWRIGTEDPVPYMAKALGEAVRRRGAAIDAPTDRQQIAWMEDWAESPASWKRHQRGPKPGEEGCRVAPDIQRQHGATPFGETPLGVGAEVLPFPQQSQPRSAA